MCTYNHRPSTDCPQHTIYLNAKKTTTQHP